MFKNYNLRPQPRSRWGAALEKFHAPPAPRIYGMPWVDWPAVGADPGREAARFLAFLPAFVVSLAQTFAIDRTKTAGGHHDVARCARQPSLPLSDRLPSMHGTRVQPAAGAEPSASSARYKLCHLLCGFISFQCDRDLARERSTLGLTAPPMLRARRGSTLPRRRAPS
jgi:hypothetical protein